MGGISAAPLLLAHSLAFGEVNSFPAMFVNTGPPEFRENSFNVRGGMRRMSGLLSEAAELSRAGTTESQFFHADPLLGKV
jgi:hypothetical protein